MLSRPCTGTDSSSCNFSHVCLPLPTLCRYGHFVVTKLVSLAPKEQLPGQWQACWPHLAVLSVPRANALCLGTSMYCTAYRCRCVHTACAAQRMASLHWRVSVSVGMTMHARQGCETWVWASTVPPRVMALPTATRPAACISLQASRLHGGVGQPLCRWGRPEVAVLHTNKTRLKHRPLLTCCLLLGRQAPLSSRVASLWSAHATIAAAYPAAPQACPSRLTATWAGCSCHHLNALAYLASNFYNCSCPRVLSATGLLKAFRGHLGELLRHPAGNHVVDDLYAGGECGCCL